MKNRFVSFLILLLVVCLAFAVVLNAESKSDDIKSGKTEVSETDFSGGFVDTAPSVDTMPIGIDVPNDNSNDKYPVSYYDEAGTCGYVCDGHKYFFFKRVFNNAETDLRLSVDLSTLKSYGDFPVDVYMLPTSYGIFLKGTSCTIFGFDSSDVCYTTVPLSSVVDPVVILEDLKQNVFSNPLYFSYETSSTRG